MQGLKLSERFYFEVVGPLLREYSADLRYSAGLLGYGSDVLGFDDSTSTDHNWGPRLVLFLDDTELDRAPEIDDVLRRRLPPAIAGFSTNFTPKRDDQTQSMARRSGSEVNHLVELHGIEEYFRSQLQAEITGLNTADWLRIPEQTLLELTSGRVFHDGLERLDDYRKRLSFYPLEVRKLRLAAYWDCIANEEAFVGRMVEYDDSVGVKTLAARLVTSLIKICFVLRKRYSPYSKWLTVAFRGLRLPEITRSIERVLHEAELKAVERGLAELYSSVLQLQNESGDYPVVDPRIRTYYERPYAVIMANRIVRSLLDSLEDPKLKEVQLSSIALDGKLVSTDFTTTDLLRRAAATER